LGLRYGRGKLRGQVTTDPSKESRTSTKTWGKRVEKTQTIKEVTASM